MTSCRPRLRILLAALSLVAAMAGHADQSVPVRFDADSHTLSIAPAKAMLSEVLREISRQSGVEMRLDPAEDREIDVAMKQQPIADALRALARQNRLNFVMGHVRESNGQQRLASFSVLREGEMSAADIPPLDVSTAPKQPGMGELRKQRLAAAASMKKDDSSEKKERKAVDEERKKKRQAAREQREAEKAGHDKQRNAARRDKKENDVARLKARHEEEMARLKQENPKKWEKHQARLEEQRSKRQADARATSSTATKTE